MNVRINATHPSLFVIDYLGAILKANQGFLAQMGINQTGFLFPEGA